MQIRGELFRLPNEPSCWPLSLPFALAGWGPDVARLGELQSRERGRGPSRLRRSAKALEATGALIWVQFARYLLAQVFAKVGALTDAKKLVDQALLAVAATSGRWYEAELHRLKVDLLVRTGGSPAAAETCYQRAMAVAERQGARLWHLRASNALAGLWCTQGRTRKCMPCWLRLLHALTRRS